jgi:hypothetical protein
MSDYPAAHSMDTTWYAMDADGHVAELISGANGAVPVDRPYADPGDGGNVPPDVVAAVEYFGSDMTSSCG